MKYEIDERIIDYLAYILQVDGCVYLARENIDGCLKGTYNNCEKCWKEFFKSCEVNSQKHELSKDMIKAISIILSTRLCPHNGCMFIGLTKGSAEGVKTCYTCWKHFLGYPDAPDTRTPDETYDPGEE